MNSELLHIVKIVVNGNSYINKKSFISKNTEHIASVKFYVVKNSSKLMKLLKKKVKFSKVASNEVDWYEYLVRSGCKRLYLDLGMTYADDRNLSAFANGLRKWRIVASYSDYSISWHKRWRYDNNTRKWTVEYYGKTVDKFHPHPTEEESKVFERLDNSLREISDFAEVIGFDWWSKYFYLGREKLKIETKKESDIIPESCDELYFKLLNAISCSWGFGGMGTWNDLPPYYAHEKGLDEEYDKVTNQLYESYMKTLEWLCNES